MGKTPKVEKGDWVSVGNLRAIVQELYPPEHEYAFWFIYIDKHKPSKHMVFWDGKNWAFPDIPGYYGSYVRDSEPYVCDLKKGEHL